MYVSVGGKACWICQRYVLDMDVVSEELDCQGLLETRKTSCVKLLVVASLFHQSSGRADLC